MCVPRPIQPPTGAEYAVLFWAILIVLVGSGAVCLFLGYRAPAEEADEAAQLIRHGYALITAGLIMWVIRRFFCGFSA